MWTEGERDDLAPMGVRYGTSVLGMSRRLGPAATLLGASRNLAIYSDLGQRVTASNRPNVTTGTSRDQPPRWPYLIVRSVDWEAPQDPWGITLSMPTDPETRDTVTRDW